VKNRIGVVCVGMLLAAGCHEAPKEISKGVEDISKEAEKKIPELLRPILEDLRQEAEAHPEFKEAIDKAGDLIKHYAFEFMREQSNKKAAEAEERITGCQKEAQARVHSPEFFFTTPPTFAAAFRECLFRKPEAKP